MPGNNLPFSFLTISNDTNLTFPVIFRLHLWSVPAWPELRHFSTCCLQNLIMSSCHNGHPHLTACYSAIHPRQWNHSPPGCLEPPMSLSLRLLSVVWPSILSAFSGFEGNAKLFRDGWSVRMVQRKWKHPYQSPAACDSHIHTQRNTNGDVHQKRTRTFRHAS